MVNKCDEQLETNKSIDALNELSFDKKSSNYTTIKKRNLEKFFQIELVNNDFLNVNINEKLCLEFFKEKCLHIAKNLLGKLLLNKTPEGIVGGIIVETEAYLGKFDPACHFSNGFTKRNIPFYKGRCGTIYIFKIHRYNNLNIISEKNSYTECVLIRALEPTHGLNLMKKRRGTDNVMRLTTGPGKLTEALGITKEKLNNKKLHDSTIYLYHTNYKNFNIITTNRIGISKAKDWPLRYCIEDNSYISKKLKNEDTLISFNEDYYYKKCYLPEIHTLDISYETRG